MPSRAKPCQSRLPVFSSFFLRSAAVSHRSASYFRGSHGRTAAELQALLFVIRRQKQCLCVRVCVLNYVCLIMYVCACVPSHIGTTNTASSGLNISKAVPKVRIQKEQCTSSTTAAVQQRLRYKLFLPLRQTRGVYLFCVWS